MIRMNVILTVKDESNIDQVQSLLSEQGRRSREEPGCVRFEVYHSNEEERVFILHEWWESRDALDVHRTAHAYTQIYKPQVLPLVDRVPHPSTLVE